MSNAPDLVLLTAAYPYGNKSETFLETEIGVLARRFPRIYLLPSHREAGVRPLPGNVELVEMAWLEESPRAARWGALASAESVGVLARTLGREGNLAPYLGAPRTYLDLLARNVLKARELRRFVTSRSLHAAVFYDYWFENSTLALALLRREGTVSTAVSRAHGFDVYDERWDHGRVPFREAKLLELDLVAAVSEFGAEYLRARAPEHSAPIRVFPLGVQSQPPVTTPRGAVPLVLSCGSLLPAKRIHLIPEVLEALDRPLSWVHLGDGPERAQVERAAGRLPERVQWKLEGHVDNSDVLRFYREHHVDVIMSLSLSEGLPVSMMEAISFGVPVVATAVHGVPEIVNETTGVLLPRDADLDSMATMLGRALEPDRFNADEIRTFFHEHFEASVNYNSFADVLIALWKDQTAAA